MTSPSTLVQSVAFALPHDFPVDLTLPIRYGTSVRNARFRYANRILRDRYNAQIKQGTNNKREYYIVFQSQEDEAAFVLKYGYYQSK